MKQTKIDTSFAESVMEENYSLHIIAFNKDSVLAVDKSNNKAHFFYDASEFMGTNCSFHFNLLSEVGQRYQQWFLFIMRKLHFKLDVADTPTDYYNTIISK